MPGDCMYSENRWFRSRVVMSRHGFGRGEYRYYIYPLAAHAVHTPHGR